MSKQIEALKKLELTDEEIAEVLDCDKRIDKGEKLFTLDKEQEKASKKARNIGQKTVYTFTKREKQPNEEKREIIAELAQIAETEHLEIVNPEREFLFTRNGTKYKVVLSVPRK